MKKTEALIHLLIFQKILQQVQNLVRNIVHDPPWPIWKSSYIQAQAIKTIIRKYWTDLTLAKFQGA